MRLFVALAISGGVRESLAALLAELRRADPKPRWISPANLHVTLKFIGQVRDEKLPEIVAALGEAALPPQIALEFRGIGFFPNDRRPAVVWAGIEAAPRLAALARGIEQALENRCGIPRETRPFAPHLTLARLQQPRLPEPLRHLIAASKERVFGKQTAAEFHLMESKTKSTGAEYTTLRSFPLGPEEKQP